MEVEYNENISKEQSKYNLEIKKLKDQIFENDIIQKTLEKEVSYVVCIITNIKLFIIIEFNQFQIITKYHFFPF